MYRSDSKKTFSTVNSVFGTCATRSYDHKTQKNIKANTSNSFFNLHSASRARVKTSSKRQRPKIRGKVGVVVIHKHGNVSSRCRTESRDTAGTFISQFIPGDIPRDESTRHQRVKINCSLHREHATSYIDKHDMDVSWTKLWYLHDNIISWMKDQHEGTQYLGPAYPRGRHGGTSKHVADTQLYVTGGIEDVDGDDLDTAAVNAARREVAEEIGLQINLLDIMGKSQGNYWFVAEV